MKQNQLDTAPKEFFSRENFSSLPQNPGSSLWAGFFECLIFMSLISAGVIHTITSFPKYGLIAEIALWVLVGIFFIISIVFSRKEMVLYHPVGYLYASTLIVSTMGFQFCFLAYSLTMVLVGAGGVGGVPLAKGLLITGWFVALLVGGVVAFIWMNRRMKQRILEGHFRPGGSGFFGDFKWKRKVPAISAAAFAIVMALIPISQILSKSGVGIEWDDSAWPLEILLATVFICVVLLLFAYLFVVSFIRIYYIKRFGVETKPPPKIPKEYLKRWK